MGLKPLPGLAGSRGKAAALSLQRRQEARAENCSSNTCPAAPWPLSLFGQIVKGLGLGTAPMGKVC
jgi:hypothetical protein